jgi:anti-anti-sigma factor
VSNADDALAQITAALGPDVSMVIVDLTTTDFCDSAGLRQLLRARERVTAGGARLRLAVARSGQVRRALELSGILPLLPVFPSLEHAIDGRWHGDR